LDGHGSHLSIRIRQIAFQEKIFLFCLPPKTTHKTQPLDAGVFNRVQAEWKKICERSARVDDSVSKATTIENYMTAREVAMQPEIIVNAWRRTGHYPFNPDIFTDEDYAPSKVTSTIAHLPPTFPDAPIAVVESDLALTAFCPPNVPVQDPIILGAAITNYVPPNPALDASAPLDAAAQQPLVPTPDAATPNPIPLDPVLISASLAAPSLPTDSGAPPMLRPADDEAPLDVDIFGSGAVNLDQLEPNSTHLTLDLADCSDPEFAQGTSLS
jgi:hypothetical protein